MRSCGLVADSDGAQPETRKNNPLLALKLKLKVIITDEKVTRRITAPFARLFSPGVALPMLAAFAAISWWVFVEKGLASALHQALYQPGMILALWAMIVASAAFHEFGHAAACRYGGATPGAMGAGLYLVWPAFYTEVTDSYRLGRPGRLRLDVGGLYFNAVFTVMAWALWWWLRWDALPLKRWARVVVVLWAVSVVPVLIGVLTVAVLLLPILVATAWASMGYHLDAAAGYWAEGDLAGVVVRLLSVLLVALPVLSIGYLLARIVRRTVRRVWRARRARRASARAPASSAWPWPRAWSGRGGPQTSTVRSNPGRAAASLTSPARRPSSTRRTGPGSCRSSTSRSSNRCCRRPPAARPWGRRCSCRPPPCPHSSC